MQLNELEKFIKKIDLENSRILNEIIDRVECLNNLGLGYLTLNRKSSTLEDLK